MKTTYHTTQFDAWRAGRTIDGALLLDYRAHLEARYPAPSSRNRHLSALKPYLNELRIRGEVALTRDDIRDSLHWWTVPQHEPDVLTQAEVKALVVAATSSDVDPRLARFVLIGLTTGARLGELQFLTGAAFYESKVLRIYASKTQRARRVPLNYSQTLTALSSRLLGRPELLVGYTRISMQLQRPWAALLKAAGLPNTHEPRCLRRTAASFAASSGKVPAVWLAEWFGHSDKVADRFYRLAQTEAAGDTIEEWYGCPAEFKLLLAAVHGAGLTDSALNLATQVSSA